MLNETHDPSIESWVESAHASEFPLQNLPLGIFRRRNSGEPFRVATAIGDQVLDVAACVTRGLLPGLPDAVARACQEPALNALMALGRDAASAVRRATHAVLRVDAARHTRDPVAEHLIPVSEAEPSVPVRVGNYTDFFASVHHATNAWALFRPGEPLPENYHYVPLAYHGRASSVVISGTTIVRPHGQQRRGNTPPVFAPTTRLDYELEIGFFVVGGNPLGTPIGIADAERHLFGCCLLNDWSARDIQAWESYPLGPFLSKSFATSVSPWVVTFEALAPFRCAAAQRADDRPRPLPYLWFDDDQRAGAVRIDLEASLLTRRMREKGQGAAPISRANFDAMYWTPAQLVAHHTSNGCNLEAGDLLGSGTVSGPEPHSQSCLLERTRGGREPLALDDGDTRGFLEDGDEVIFRGSCSAPGYAPIGFGECRGRVGD